MGIDALICLEVVEHLDPHLVEALPKTIFGSYRPKLAIISTPNAEFNINFPELKYGTEDTTFRHNDHRFEWTRPEFEMWCGKQAKEYNYSVSFSGVGLINTSEGELPSNVGFCSQIAVFLDLAPYLGIPMVIADEPEKPLEPYSHFASVSFPIPFEGQNIKKSRLAPQLQSSTTAFSRLFDTSGPVYREIPRSYQLRLFAKAQESNVLAVLDTGAGKTLGTI